MLLFVLFAADPDQGDHQETQADQLRLIKVTEESRPQHVAHEPVRPWGNPMPARKSPVTFPVKMYSQNSYTDQPGHIQDLAHRLIVLSRVRHQSPPSRLF